MSNLGIAGFDLYRTKNEPPISFAPPNAKYQPKRSQKIKNKRKKGKKRK